VGIPPFYLVVLWLVLLRGWELACEFQSGLAKIPSLQAPTPHLAQNFLKIFDWYLAKTGFSLLDHGRTRCDHNWLTSGFHYSLVSLQGETLPLCECSALVNEIHRQ
jgi:hypothetical protein